MKLYILFVSNQILNLTINHGRFRGYPARHGTWATPLMGIYGRQPLEIIIIIIIYRKKSLKATDHFEYMWTWRTWFLCFWAISLSVHGGLAVACFMNNIKRVLTQIVMESYNNITWKEPSWKVLSLQIPLYNCLFTKMLYLFSIHYIAFSHVDTWVLDWGLSTYCATHSKQWLITLIKLLYHFNLKEN